MGRMPGTIILGDDKEDCTMMRNESASPIIGTCEDFRGGGFRLPHREDKKTKRSRSSSNNAYASQIDDTRHRGCYVDRLFIPSFATCVSSVAMHRAVVPR